MNTKTKEDIAREHLMQKSVEPKGDSVKGYDFNNGVDFAKILESYKTTGSQATNLGHAIDIIEEMRKNSAYIYLGYTSNMVSGGLRDIFRYLVEHKMVDCIVTSAGGIEEDIIKCFGDFKIGNFTDKGSKLREEGINRAGNILIPNSRYCDFEEFLKPILEEELERQKNEKESLTPSKLIHLLGKKINNPESIYYWAEKNNIPVFCPAITDGSLGDMIYLFKSNNPDFNLDISEDIVRMNNTTFEPEKIGVIILGGGIAKHHILNANMFRDGADYAVYINTAQEFDGSDSGARPDEGVSWGKIQKNAKATKVHADASLVFPLIVAKCFSK